MCVKIHIEWRMAVCDANDRRDRRETTTTKYREKKQIWMSERTNVAKGKKKMRKTKFSSSVQPLCIVIETERAYCLY